MRTHQHQHHHRGTLIATTHFPRRRESVRLAREWIRWMYALTGGNDTAGEADTCALLVSELTTNAVEYAHGDTFAVTLWTSPLSVGVWDASPYAPELRAPRPDDEHGRGLLLVSALAARFEVTPDDGDGGGKLCRFWLDEERCR
ncbi:ATP-binding protein [Streptomyces sp. NPDC004610]|uniref:ATP-binding protein n=1 Tax=unclassified Streptomyces TaxID=2593676 RepID=UPI0033A775CD